MCWETHAVAPKGNGLVPWAFFPHAPLGFFRWRTLHWLSWNWLHQMPQVLLLPRKEAAEAKAEAGPIQVQPQGLLYPVHCPSNWRKGAKGSQGKGGCPEGLIGPFATLWPCDGQDWLPLERKKKKKKKKKKRQGQREKRRKGGKRNPNQSQKLGWVTLFILFLTLLSSLRFFLIPKEYVQKRTTAQHVRKQKLKINLTGASLLVIILLIILSRRGRVAILGIVIVAVGLLSGGRHLVVSGGVAVHGRRVSLGRGSVHHPCWRPSTWARVLLLAPWALFGVWWLVAFFSLFSPLSSLLSPLSSLLPSSSASASPSASPSASASASFSLVPLKSFSTSSFFLPPRVGQGGPWKEGGSLELVEISHPILLLSFCFVVNTLICRPLTYSPFSL